MDNNEILPVQRTGTFAALIIATFVTSMSTTVTANMIPNFTEFIFLRQCQPIRWGRCFRF